MQSVVATDNTLRALRGAADKLERLNLKQSITLENTDLFPSRPQKADLIVCNPPWIPENATAPIERTINDPNGIILKGYINGLSKHLNAEGPTWLVMSNLAELLGLRSAKQLHDRISAAGLTIVQKHSVAPKHAKTNDRRTRCLLHEQTRSLVCIRLK